ncbi:hypothetical protein EUGRSUZ_L01935 [Eucalyptus grandis]|uniref:Defensin-like protein n=1 Tax=Eucalyptus grandis TaxID=71139 RepID=A0A058ZU44_EUCGR|nr:hypothetical protein EUGRSUZ_L01935 [Eucalyptus grandis]
MAEVLPKCFFSHCPRIREFLSHPLLDFLCETKTLVSHEKKNRASRAPYLPLFSEQRCSASHGPGLQGSCDQSTSHSLCTCYYNCPSPPQPPPSPKICNGCEDLCNNACTDQCCSNRCAAKFSQGR